MCQVAAAGAVEQGGVKRRDLLYRQAIKTLALVAAELEEKMSPPQHDGSATTRRWSSRVVSRAAAATVSTEQSIHGFVRLLLRFGSSCRL